MEKFPDEKIVSLLKSITHSLSQIEFVENLLRNNLLNESVGCELLTGEKLRIQEFEEELILMLENSHGIPEVG